MRKFLLFLCLISIFCTGCWFKKEQALKFTGTIEATTSNLSPKITAKVIWVAEEGTPVKKDQLVAELEKTEYEILYNKAKANLKFYTNKTIQAENAYEYQTQYTKDNITIARENIKASNAQLSEANVNLTQARTDYQRWIALYKQGAVSKRDLENAENNYKIAKTAFTSARADFERQKALLSEALSSVKQDIIKQQEVKASEDSKSQAKADAERAKEYLGYTKISAPFPGWVNKKILEVGELASPGVPVVTLINLNDMWIEVFVPEDQIGKIKLDGSASITVDSYPGEKFSGKVIYISKEAEFTPKNVQTQKERVTLVYRIKIKVENPEQKLKPGTPADVLIKEVVQ